MCFTPEPRCTFSSSSKLAALMGGQARWQGLVERHAAAFKGFSHLCCIQIVLGSEKGESTSQQQAGNQILMGNLNPTQSRPQHLLISIKRPFSGLPSIPDGCTCFFLVSLCKIQLEKVFVVLQVLPRHRAGWQLLVETRGEATASGNPLVS